MNTLQVQECRKPKEPLLSQANANNDDDLVEMTEKLASSGQPSLRAKGYPRAAIAGFPYFQHL